MINDHDIILETFIVIRQEVDIVSRNLNKTLFYGCLFHFFLVMILALRELIRGNHHRLEIALKYYLKNRLFNTVPGGLVFLWNKKSVIKPKVKAIHG